MDGIGTEQRTRRIAGNILIFLLGLALTMSSIVKFASVPGVVHDMAADGFANGKLTLVATLEILSAALFLFPRTRSFGVLVLSSFLGGAICTHVQMSEYAKGIGPFILLTLAWFGVAAAPAGFVGPRSWSDGDESVSFPEQTRKLGIKKRVKSAHSAATNSTLEEKGKSDEHKHPERRNTTCSNKKALVLRYMVEPADHVAAHSGLHVD